MSKKYKIAIFIALIGAVGVIIAAVIQRQAANSSAESKPTISLQTDSGTNNNAGRDINQAGRDNISAGGNVTVFNVDTSKHKEKIVVKKEQPKVVIDQSVTTQNQTGGIAAHTVVVPEDKEIPLIDNYEVLLGNTDEGYKITVRPKHGQWYPSFIAYPLKEDEFVKGSPAFTKGVIFNMSIGPYMFHTGTDSLEYKVFIFKGDPSTPILAYMLKCKKYPSHLFFGEWENSTKTYIKQF